MKIGGVEITTGSAAFRDRTDWTTRQIQGSEKGTVFKHWFGAIVPLLFIGAFTWFSHMPLFINKKVPNPVLSLAALVALFSAIRAIWETIRLKRFGDPVLELSAAPVPLGGTVEGRINLGSGLQQAPEFTVTLACIHRVHTNNGKNSSDRETVLWSAENKTSMLLGGIVPISIAVPTDKPQTNGANPFDRILWRVTVKAPFRGPAFLEKYEVPVGQPMPSDH